MAQGMHAGAWRPILYDKHTTQRTGRSSPVVRRLLFCLTGVCLLAHRTGGNSVRGQTAQTKLSPQRLVLDSRVNSPYPIQGRRNTLRRPIVSCVLAAHSIPCNQSIPYRWSSRQGGRSSIKLYVLELQSQAVRARKMTRTGDPAIFRLTMGGLASGPLGTFVGELLLEEFGRVGQRCLSPFPQSPTPLPSGILLTLAGLGVTCKREK
ncbi:hypothetical protein LZ32DRAFT_310156 [Colletotrichum eremochloae]|nr:hypothetical protein LZ32DRAFT_310156 [Colletotrichum eremochloae]